MCPDCQRNLRTDGRTENRYEILCEALLFAHFQRDDFKVAKRLGQLNELLVAFPDLRCLRHRTTMRQAPG